MISTLASEVTRAHRVCSAFVSVAQVKRTVLNVVRQIPSQRFFTIVIIMILSHNKRYNKDKTAAGYLVILESSLKENQDGSRAFGSRARE